MLCQSFKCGKVVFMGEPNVGKSSLVNKLVGEQVSIVTDMAGTTREEIRGVLNGKDFQIVFLDTPGMGSAKTNLDRFMNKSISFALGLADVVCYVTDNTLDDVQVQKIKNLFGKKPMIVVVNKIDKSSFEKLYPRLSKLNDLGVVVVPVSARSGQNLDVLVNEIVKLLPVGERLFDEDLYTDQSVRKMCAEIVRGELIKVLEKDVPHGLAVNVTGFIEKGSEVEINADIIVGKQSHKPIVIGKKGAVLKTVGTRSRGQIEELVGKHVRLFTHVVVREGWKDKQGILNELGYIKK